MWTRVASASTLVLFLGIALWLASPMRQSMAAANLFDRFSAHVVAGEWAAASAMMAPGGECAIVNGRVIAFGVDDITDQIGPTNPKWLAMIDHHRQQSPWEGQKYIFCGGYVLIDLEREQITRIKLP